VGVTVGVDVLVGVLVLVGVGVGGGHTPPSQLPPINTETIGLLTDGFLPQKRNSVSGEIIVSTKTPLQSIKDMLCSLIVS
jgi:hypothetical protein